MGKSKLIIQKSRTPILEQFGISFDKIISKDKTEGIQYFFRKNEINTLIKALLKRNKKHIALIGEEGIGRKTLIKSFAEHLDKGDASLLMDYRFYKLDLISMMIDTKYRGQLEERIKALINEIEKEKNILLFINDIDEQENNMSLIYSLLRSNVRIITIFTPQNAELFFKNKETYSFHKIRLTPPNNKEVVSILKKNITKFQQEYSLKINNKIISSIIEYSNLYLINEMQPQKSISLLEEVCSSVELKRLNNPDEIISSLRDEFIKNNNEIEQINKEKKIAVKDQKFEIAAKLRDKEKKLEEKSLLLKNKIQEKLNHTEVQVKEEDIVNAVQLLTGIDREKILKKENIYFNINTENKPAITSLPKFEFLQTQSILNGNKISIKRGSAFVLIPHNKEFNDLYNHFIKPALEEHSLNVLKADSIFEPGNILSQVWEKIRTSEVLVVDVSGQNSNVIFELGLCYGIQRCPILLTRDPSELPFNIRNLRYIQYENTASGAHKLREKLKVSVGEFLSAVRTSNY